MLAFFYEAGAADASCVERYQQSFLRLFGLAADEKPLLRLDVDADRPFSMATG